ncbi:hypothetical protein MMC26_000584 [Xylographa opegraphella]|nr:hypothetical protein [Xylographa opegraphella]
MCIALISTAHPKYALILIDNRDEYLCRPTARAAWWDLPNQHVLGARDLQRDVHGTWLGVTTDGRVAVLTNFRDDVGLIHGSRSRGAIVNAYLTEPTEKMPKTEDFVSDLINENNISEVGGFSLICGRMGKPLAVVSNRTSSKNGIAWVATETGQTIGLSNAAFSDRSWPKVLTGEKLMEAAIAKAVSEDFNEDQLIQEMLALLSRDTLPRSEQSEKEESWVSILKYLRLSIFIPLVTGQTAESATADELAAAKNESQITVNCPESGMYGTQQQSVILLDHDGQCTFFERSVYGESDSKDRKFQFRVLK